MVEIDSHHVWLTTSTTMLSIQARIILENNEYMRHYIYALLGVIKQQKRKGTIV